MSVTKDNESNAIYPNFQSKEFDSSMDDAPLDKMAAGFKCVGTYRYFMTFVVKCCMLVMRLVTKTLKRKGSSLSHDRTVKESDQQKNGQLNIRKL